MVAELVRVDGVLHIHLTSRLFKDSIIAEEKLESTKPYASFRIDLGPAVTAHQV